MRLAIVTIGFDEKLPLRGVLKFGLADGDVIMLIYSKTGGEFEVKKVERAVESLKDIVAKVGAKVVDVIVSGSDFFGDVVSILRALREHRADDVVAVLAGGMRILVFEVITALLLRYAVGGARSKVYVAREDGLYDVILPVETFYVSLASREDAVLRKLFELGGAKRSQLVDAVSREVGLSESMVYRVVKNLVKKGLASVEGDHVKLTAQGRLVCEASMDDKMEGGKRGEATRWRSTS